MDPLPAVTDVLGRAFPDGYQLIVRIHDSPSETRRRSVGNYEIIGCERSYFPSVVLADGDHLSHVVGIKLQELRRVANASLWREKFEGRLNFEGKDEQIQLLRRHSFPILLDVIRLTTSTGSLRQSTAAV
jgi:hypothetical protein